MSFKRAAEHSSPGVPRTSLPPPSFSLPLWVTFFSLLVPVNLRSVRYPTYDTRISCQFFPVLTPDAQHTISYVATDHETEPDVLPFTASFPI